MSLRQFGSGILALGFGAIGVFCMGAALLSCVIVLAFVREESLEVDIGEA